MKRFQLTKRYLLVMLASAALLSAGSPGRAEDDASRIILVNDTRRVLLLHLDDGTLEHLVDTPVTLLDIAVAPDGDVFATGIDRYLWRYRLSPKTWERVGSLGSQVNALEFGADGRLYAAGSNAVYVLDPATAARRILIGLPVPASGDLAETCDGKLLLTLRGSSSDYLAEIDPSQSTGHTIGPLGYENVWGMAFSGGRLTGFSNDRSGAPRSLEIDPVTAASSTIRIYPTSDIREILGASRLAAPPAAPVLYDVTPSTGSQSGVVTVLIHGESLPGGPVSVRMIDSKRGSIEAMQASVTRCNAVSATFDLRGAELGPRQIQVAWNDGPTLDVPETFEIAAGRGPDVHVTLVAPPRYRLSGNLDVQVVVTNDGDADAFGVPVFVDGIAPDATVEVQSPMTAIGDPNAPPDAPAAIQLDESQVVGVIVPQLSPGESQSVNIRVAGSRADQMSVRAWSLPPFLEPAAPNGSQKHVALRMKEDFFCLKTLIEETIARTPAGPAKEVFDCVYKKLDGLIEFFAEIPDRKSGGAVLWSYADYLQAYFIGCVKDRLVTDFYKQLFKILNVINGAREVYKHCGPLFQPWIDAVTATIQGVASIDPNDKIGPAGSGTDHWVAGNSSLAYMIRFENLATATAPAAEVVIEDRLDPSLFDLDTFQFGEITFGAFQLLPSQSGRVATGVIDLRPRRAGLVQVSGTIDDSTGLVTWRLQTVSASTGLPPTDPLAGFLPPNRLPPEGEGRVSFKVRPRLGLDTRSFVPNTARITFDANPAIDTPAVSNRIDSVPPRSRAVSVARRDKRERLRIHWHAEDDDSGVGSGEIWVRENDGDYRERGSAMPGWISIPAHYGSEYEIFSIARDGAGNREAMKEEPDVSVQLGVSIAGIRRELNQFARTDKVPGVELLNRLREDLASARGYMRDKCLADARRIIGDDFSTSIRNASPSAIENTAAERLQYLAQLFLNVPSSEEPRPCVQ